MTKGPVEEDLLMAPTPLTPEQLREHLKEQVAFLEDSSRLYDEGKEYEAKRLATSIRILVHDTSQSRSLLGQLGVKDTIDYWSVPLVDCDPTARSYLGIGMSLAVRDGKSSARYVPLLLPPQRRLRFNEWWNEEFLIIEDAERVSRRRAVLALANKDGGAHVDPALDELDQRLLTGDLLGWKSITLTGAQSTTVKRETVLFGDQPVVLEVNELEGGVTTEEPSDLTSPTRAAVRQIAHELCGTIRDRCQNLLA